LRNLDIDESVILKKWEKILCEFVDSVVSIQDMVDEQILTNTILKFGVPRKMGRLILLPAKVT
jgi:hypothetical protein